MRRLLDFFRVTGERSINVAAEWSFSMKVRIISARVGLAILGIIFALFETVVVNIAVALLAILAVYELLSATGCFKDRFICILAMVFSGVIPFLSIQWVMRNVMLICYLYVGALFCILLRRHQKLHIEQIAMSFMFSLVIPFSLTTLIYMRDRFGSTLGIFYVLVALGSSFLSDTGAYFSGRFFGRHKLAPYISPKKTVEGAIGGAIFAEFSMALVAWVYAEVVEALGAPIVVNFPQLLLLTPVFSGVSILGDLSASVIKRQYGVKDYGSIMPGHGGIMDRFDSVLMVAPLVFLVSRWLPFAQMA